MERLLLYYVMMKSSDSTVYLALCNLCKKIICTFVYALLSGNIYGALLRGRLGYHIIIKNVNFID